jgi:hypothetical protein
VDQAGIDEVQKGVAEILHSPVDEPEDLLLPVEQGSHPAALLWLPALSFGSVVDGSLLTTSPPARHDRSLRRLIEQT